MQIEKVSNKSKAHSTFGLLLREEFLKRCKNNPSYSLRSFARQLDIDPSLLSKILRGQRRASAEVVKSVAPRIGIRPSQLSKLLKGKEEVAYSSMSDDIFSVIGDWYHFAILELMKTHSFQSDANWIANRLSIRKAEAEAALRRLERLGFTELQSQGYVLKATHNTWANNEMTSAARKDLQRQLTLKAAEAIDNVPFELRESGSLTVACPRELLPELKKKIQKFRREIDEYIEAHEKSDEVYQLMVSFFPLTRIQTKTGESK